MHFCLRPVFHHQLPRALVPELKTLLTCAPPLPPPTTKPTLAAMFLKNAKQMQKAVKISAQPTSSNAADRDEFSVFGRSSG